MIPTKHRKASILLSLVLALCLTFSLACPAFAEGEEPLPEEPEILAEEPVAEEEEVTEEAEPAPEAPEEIIEEEEEEPVPEEQEEVLPAEEEEPAVLDVPEEETTEEEEPVLPEEEIVLTPKAQAGPVYTANPMAGKGEVRGLWISYVDFPSLGLKDVNAATFRKNIGKVLDEAKKYKTNTVFFHVRIFDDAVWKSDHFKACGNIVSGAGYTVSSKVYTYDPLQIVIEEAHARGMELHAWMNPYRITSSYYWDPGDTKSTNRILVAVEELLEYDIDGIHFDDYFYNAGTGYYRVGMKKANGTYKKYAAPSSAATKRTNVNRMVKAVYNKVHTKKDVAFGIAPQGNYDNAMASGADITTWLSVKGYADYLCPQIYWTDNWGTYGGNTLFTDRVTRFKNANKLALPMYVGLGLYCAADGMAGDYGWQHDTAKNWLARQVKILRTKGMKGYVLFSARYLFHSGAKAELQNLRNLLYPNKITKTGVNNPTSLIRYHDYAVKGTVSSEKYNIRRVEAGIVSKKTGKYVSGHYYDNKSVNSKTFDLRKTRSSLRFFALPAGTYYYRVWVHTTMGQTSRVINREFKVVSCGVTIKDVAKPGTLTYGKDFSVKGSIKSTSKITRLEIGVVNKATGKWTSCKYDNRNVGSKTFDIRRAEKRLDFGKLPKGSYYYRIIVKNGKGSHRVVNKPFTVK